MLEKMLFESLPLVTTPLSLVAFLAAAVVVMHARTTGRAEKLIRSSPLKDRSTLVEGALEILDVRTKDLTREQRFELALELLAQRRHRNFLVFWLSILFATFFAGLTFYSFIREDIRGDVEKILSEKNIDEVIPILNKKGIFYATDKEIVEYLIEKSRLPDEIREKLGDSKGDLEAQKLYNSVASIKELRKRAERRDDPFKPIGERGLASTPDRNQQPRQFTVHVPMNSKYANRIIKITSVNTDNYIRVYARPSMEPSNNVMTDLHLNSEQAKYLENTFPANGRLNIIIRESEQEIFDPNCSQRHNSSFQRSAKELCSKGNTATISYLQQHVFK